jgi:hypothetical protein
MQGKKPIFLKNLAFRGIKMYSEDNINQIKMKEMNGKYKYDLDPNNRWIKLEKNIPWDMIEKIYSSKFKNKRKDGARPKSSRIAFGSLIIKEIKRLTDEETVQEIQESPYLQYFIGFREFRHQQPFDPSMMVHFRKRFTLEELNEINEIIEENMNKKKREIK